MQLKSCPVAAPKRQHVNSQTGNGAKAVPLGLERRRGILKNNGHGPYLRRSITHRLGRRQQRPRPSSRNRVHARAESQQPPILIDSKSRGKVEKWPLGVATVDPENCKETSAHLKNKGLCPRRAGGHIICHRNRKAEIPPILAAAIATLQRK